ncbi:MAG TPA: hypothetical protein VN962_04170 [Polyangia bacterium]|jgi:hypothetical protein|nr:hypothetical protein [Polyangia bacterium]
MGEPQIQGIKDAEFEATAAFDGQALVLRLLGNADLRVNAPLGPFLDSVDDQARRAHTGEVVADFRQLVFMNSSCLKEFVRWIAQVDERATDHYRIRFLSDPSAQWQSRSLQALRAFAPNLVTIES